jgi:hypothetical protein
MSNYLVSGVYDDSDNVQEFIVEELDKALEVAKRLFGKGSSLVSIELYEGEEET